MRFHVLGICHTVTSKEYLSCAFTQKVVKFCEMMMPSTPETIELKSKMTQEELVRHKTIHQVIHYGHERSQVTCDEHVTVMTDDILIKTYGDYNWRKEFFKHAAGDLCHTSFTANTIAELNKRRMSGDFILCFWGLGHKQIGDFFSSMCLVVEPGIGYPIESSFAEFQVYESYACMHYHYGGRKVMQPAWYHCVIPNYFDPNDFDFRISKDNYYLYLGRIIPSKGLEIVLHLAKKIGFRLLIAGQGSLEKDLGQKNLPANIEYVGFADLEKRKRLMAGAKALFLPTLYVEPFGGVTMEAMMSGTPVITTDWGVFTETVVHGVTGYRCRTLDQFEWAIRNINKINPQACRDWAMSNYSIKKVRNMYEEYFDMLLRVKFSKGFYDENPQRTELDWLFREYPQVPQGDSSGLPRKPKIAIYTETKWAFGRISQALQKYSTQFDIDIFDWSKGMPSDEMIFSDYDLVYATVWDIARELQSQFPKWAHKITFSGHGVVDFVKMKLEDHKNRRITANQVDKFDIDPELAEWLEEQPLGFSVVSHELYKILNGDRFTFKEDKNLFLTQCGADTEIFTPGQPTPVETSTEATTEPTVEATTEPTVEATTEPVEATTEPVEATTDPVEATTDPVEATTDPVGEATTETVGEAESTPKSAVSTEIQPPLKVVFTHQRSAKGYMMRNA
jgi:glycosyltransferase involved in cell wall biosynthesis